MLHVITFCGNMVMDGVVHPPPPHVTPLHPRCSLGSQQLLLMSSVGHTGFYPALIFARVSPFNSPALSVKHAPLLLLQRWNPFFCFLPPIKIASSTVVALTCCLNSEVKLGWKYPDVCMAEVKASVKTTEGACRCFVWVCCFCESLEGSQAGIGTVGPFKLVFTVEDSQGSASPVEAA